MVRLLASFGIVVLAQVGWLWYMMHSASTHSDPTVGGAYCAVWMLGIPVVFLVSLLISIVLLSRKE